jgi:hypothetical protein
VPKVITAVKLFKSSFASLSRSFSPREPDFWGRYIGEGDIRLQRISENLLVDNKNIKISLTLIVFLISLSCVFTVALKWYPDVDDN